MTKLPEVTHARAVVLFGTNWPQPGGGGLCIAYEFLRGLAAGHSLMDDCDLLVLFGEHLLRVQSATDAQAIVSRQCRSRLPRPIKWLVQAFIVWRLTTRYNETVVLTFSNFYAGALVPRRRRLWIVHTEHTKGGLHTEQLARAQRKNLWYRVLKQFSRVSLRTADRVVFPSSGARDLYARSNPWFAPESSSVVHNGLADPCAETSAAWHDDGMSGEPTVLNIAKHVPEKGLELTLEGFAAWRRSSGLPMRARLVNIGGQSEVPRALAARVASLGLTECCDFLGWRSHSEALRLLRRATVFMLTPSVAVFDVSLLEAMALGKAIISTPVGGNIDALGQDYRYFVRAPEECAAKLEALLADPALALEVGAANRRRFVRFFGVGTMIEGYWAVTASCFAANKEAPRCEAAQHA